MADWHLSNPVALWLLLVVMLFSLLMPMFAGVMQGQQNFFWLGWVNIFNGVCRVAVAVIIVLVLHGWAAGMMTGVFIGLAGGDGGGHLADAGAVERAGGTV